MKLKNKTYKFDAALLGDKAARTIRFKEICEELKDETIAGCNVIRPLSDIQNIYIQVALYDASDVGVCQFFDSTGALCLEGMLVDSKIVWSKDVDADVAEGKVEEHESNVGQAGAEDPQLQVGQ